MYIHTYTVKEAAHVNVERSTILRNNFQRYQLGDRAHVSSL